MEGRRNGDTKVVGENNDYMQPGGPGFRLFPIGYPHIGERRESRCFGRRRIHRHPARRSIFGVSIHFEEREIICLARWFARDAFTKSWNAPWDPRRFERERRVRERRLVHERPVTIGFASAGKSAEILP